jgi:hypothetical protein
MGKETDLGRRIKEIGIRLVLTGAVLTTPLFNTGCRIYPRDGYGIAMNSPNREEELRMIQTNSADIRNRGYDSPEIEFAPY